MKCRYDTKIVCIQLNVSIWVYGRLLYKIIHSVDVLQTSHLFITSTPSWPALQPISVFFLNDIVTPHLAPSQTALHHITATTKTADYMLVFVLQKLLSLLALLKQNHCKANLWVCIQHTKFVHAPKSSLFLVYLCGRITLPHTGLVCILHCFELVSVVSCVHRYFLRQRRVNRL